MNLSWLEDFLALAATGGFSRAAESRHMTQPAFSRRIRALEDWLGVPLVDRSTQPVELTEAGRWYVGVARDALARMSRMPDEARAIADASAATIRIAATHALSLTFLPAWLRRYEGRVLASPVELVSDVLERCEDAMLEHRVQFVLCHAHRAVPGRLDHRCPSKTVGRDLLLPVSAPTKAKTKTAKYRLDDAKRAPLLGYSAASGMGRIVAALDRTHDATRVVFTAHLAAVLKSMAIEGRGIAWLPESLIADDLAAHRLVEAAPAARRIGIEVRLYRDEALSASAEGFWSAVATDDAG